MLQKSPVIKKISALHFSFFFMMFMILITPVYLSAQESNSKLKKGADEYFESGKYRSALHLYRQSGLDHSKNKKIRLRIGICLYEINDIDSAIGIFQSLINEGKTEPDVFLYTGKCYQAKNIFLDAISFYKKFIEKTEQDSPLREWALDELTRCANGARLKFATQETFVENVGTDINTQYDEFGVKTSPTNLDKMYFNSNRMDGTDGTDNNTNVNIYSASIINGKWTTPVNLPTTINSPGYDEVCGFSSDGQIIYYLTLVGKTFNIKTDTFSGEEGKVYQGIFQGPYVADGGGTDLTFFNDSICIFSSDRAGGFGGFDLYISILHNGTWSEATNLGPSINSFYNERFPFLTKNGQTLFFSSDNLESIGGYDIFRSVFDPIKLVWSLPENLWLTGQFFS